MDFIPTPPPETEGRTVATFVNMIPVLIVSEPGDQLDALNIARVDVSFRRRNNTKVAVFTAVCKLDAEQDTRPERYPLQELAIEPDANDSLAIARSLIHTFIERCEQHR